VYLRVFAEKDVFSVWALMADTALSANLNERLLEGFQVPGST
jgi:hypothetical protein